MNCGDLSDIQCLIQCALKEDIGAKDITTEGVIPADKKVKAVLIAKEPCVVCGISVARAVFKQMDKNLRFRAFVKDGEPVRAKKRLASIEGKARDIMTAERVALNFLCLLSGVSTNTRRFVNEAKQYKARIIDTRKTIPGLRLLEKYAVRAGGGFNHRLSLDEMIMVKDNHLKAIGGIKKLKPFGRKYKAEIEVSDLHEFKTALALKPHIIMLDNMSLPEMKKAVSLRNALCKGAGVHSPLLEASGGITLENVKKIASCGVDMISVGALTHTVKSADISLEII